MNGLLVVPRDPAALAAAIRQLLADPAAAARLPAAARRTAVGYAWPDLARQVLEVYRHVTGPGRSRSMAGTRLRAHQKPASEWPLLDQDPPDIRAGRWQCARSDANASRAV